MILVTVGTHDQGFNRLVQAADELSLLIDEKVVIQYGVSGFEPESREAFRWATSDEMKRLTAEARVVITHAAAGAIITALKLGKPLVLVPRLKSCQEHFDDHQQQLARALAEDGMAVVVEEPTAEGLRLAVEKAGPNKPWAAGPSKLAQALRARLAAWERNG